MSPEVNSNRFEISFRGVKQLHYKRSHDFRRSETHWHFDSNFTQLNLIEVKFQSYFPMLIINSRSEIKLPRIIKVKICCASALQSILKKQQIP